MFDSNMEVILANSVEKARKAQQDFDALRKAAIEELLAQRKDIDSQLAEFGYGKTTAKVSSRVCSVCGESGHNSRYHKDKKQKKE